MNKELYMNGFNKEVAQKFCPECKAPMFMQYKGVCGYCDRFKEDFRYLELKKRVKELEEVTSTNPTYCACSPENYEYILKNIANYQSNDHKGLPTFMGVPLHVSPYAVGITVVKDGEVVFHEDYTKEGE